MCDDKVRMQMEAREDFYRIMDSYKEEMAEQRAELEKQRAKLEKQSEELVAANDQIKEKNDQLKEKDRLIAELQAALSKKWNESGDGFSPEVNKKNLAAVFSNREVFKRVISVITLFSVVNICIKVGDRSGIGVDIVIVFCHADIKLNVKLLQTIVKVLMYMSVGNICFG